MRAIFAGAFDPFTAGHVNIIKRAAALFDSVTVAVADDTGKNTAPVYVRVDIAKRSTAGIDNATVSAFHGLLSDFVKCFDEPVVLVRGIRNGRDAEYERDLSRVYKSLCGVDTVFLQADADSEHISSTVVRELAKLRAPLDGYVANGAIETVTEIYSAANKE